MYKGDIKIVIGVISIFTLIEYGRYHYNNHLLKTGIKTRCIITALNSKNIKVSFEVKGRTYENTLSNPCSCLYQKEIYTLAYNPDDPEESTILFWQPIFNRNQYATTVATEVHTLWNIGRNKNVSFKYIVKGKYYKRYQGLSPEKNSPTKQNSRVFYNLINPEIAYIEY